MRFFLSLLAVALSACTATPDGNVLTMQSLGAVKTGMTVAQAETVLGVKLAPRQDEFFEPGCWYTFSAGEKDPRVHYMVAGVVIVRIDIGNKAEAVRDPKGFGIGSDEEAVIAAYGAALENTPHPYLSETGRYLRVPDKGGRNALLFETDEGKVTSFRAGRIPFVDYIEGCS